MRGYVFMTHESLKLPNHGYALVLSFLLINIFIIPNVNANPIVKKNIEIEHQLDGRGGVSVYDVTQHELWSYNGDSHFPLMSTFKTIACAKVLADRSGAGGNGSRGITAVVWPDNRSPYYQ